MRKRKKKKKLTIETLLLPKDLQPVEKHYNIFRNTSSSIENAENGKKKKKKEKKTTTKKKKKRTREDKHVKARDRRCQ